MTLALYVVLTAAAVTFIAASAARARWYARHPIHLRWELYPVPHESPDRAARGGSYFETTEWWKTPLKVHVGAEMAFMVREILFLHALFTHNRRLWYRSFPFHAGLYLLAGTAVLLLAAGGLTAWLGPAWGAAAAGLASASRATGTVGLAACLWGAAALLVRRFTDPALRVATTPGDLFNLGFFLAALGALALTLTALPDDAPGLAAAAAGLLAWDLSLAVPPALAWSLMAVAALVAYIPLTHMSHFIGKYFTYHAVRWDDRPLAGHPDTAAALAEYLTYRPTWAARHVSAGGERTWADVVTTRPTGAHKS